MELTHKISFVAFIVGLSLIFTPGVVFSQSPSSSSRTSVASEVHGAVIGIDWFHKQLANSSPWSVDEEYLREFEPVAGAPGRGPADVNGLRYPNSIMMDSDISLGGEDIVEYNLSRKWRSLTAMIGVRDDAPSDAKARFEIFGDGKLLYSKNLAFGQSGKAVVDVRNVLRLKLKTYSLSGDSDYSMVWGDALLGR